MKPKNFIVDMLRPHAEAMGAQLVLEPGFERAGMIRFANGRYAVFRGAAFDINGEAASKIARDKDYCARFLEMAGLPSVPGVLSYAPRFIAQTADKNPAIAARLTAHDAVLDAYGEAFPLFVKPNESSEGDGVARVASRTDLLTALDDLHMRHDRVLVQRAQPGQDVRVVVLDGKIHAAYARIPLAVTGDGARSLSDLVAEAAASLDWAGRSGGVLRRHSAACDARVPAASETVVLSATANLSTGGAIADLAETLAPAHRELAVAATAAIGLRFAGVDLLVADDAAVVLEINSAPGLHNYASEGPTALARVERLYAALLDALEQG